MKRCMTADHLKKMLLRFQAEATKQSKKVQTMNFLTLQQKGAITAPQLADNEKYVLKNMCTCKLYLENTGILLLQS